MKEFEKWFGRELTKDNRWRNRDEWADNAWKAALRWAKAMHDVSSEPRFSLNITEELNGTSEKK